MYTAKPPVALNYFPPSQRLRSVISSYYVFSAGVPQLADRIRADLPQLRFMISGKVRYRLGDQGWIDSPDIALLGPTFKASQFLLQGPALVVGIGLLPAGWSLLMKEGASMGAERVLDASEVLGPVMATIMQRLQDCGESLPLIIGTLDELMTAMFADMPESLLWFIRATESWLANSSSPSVDELFYTLDRSSRQVERLANRIYGAPPKLLARKYRALKAASSMVANQGSWHDVVGDGFADQSHLIREFKRFIGMTPRELVNPGSLLTRMTIERRRMAVKLPRLTKIT